jgi:hypothetical protein
VNNTADVDLVVRVSIDDVKPASENETVYHGFDCRNADDNALYVSVKRHGVLEPLTVSADGFILSGHRRHWAAILAGLGHVPIRRVDTRLSDLQPAERLRVLTEHNTQRSKGAEEQAREAIVRASPKDAFRSLRERLAAKQAAAYDLLPTAMRIEGRTARAEITDVKTGFLDAICREVDARRAYWPLSVRQLHYALLNDPPLRHAAKRGSRYRNDHESYKALCELCARARLAGRIPWEAVADETRPVETWYCHATVADYVTEEAPRILGYYRRNLMQGQLRHVELVCEKNTVAEIVRRVAYDFCIPVTSGRGYCSLEPRRQIAERHAASGKSGCTLILLSDCDPDGDEIAVSLVRSMRDDFGLWNVAAVRAALTPEQAQRFGLPPNTDAKASSPQFKKFVARHGARNAYELEALNPEALAGIVRETIESVIDMDAYRQEVETWTAEAAELEVVRGRVTAAVMGKPRR